MLTIVQSPTFRDPQPLVGIDVTGQQTYNYPVMAQMSDGRVAVAYGVTDGTQADIQARFISTVGVVEDVTIDINSFTPGFQGGVELAALTGGGFAAVWQSDGQDGFETGIYGRIFDADGGAVTDEFQISGDVPLSQTDPHLSATSDGGFAVVWDRGIGPGWVEGSNSASTVGLRYFDNQGVALTQAEVITPGFFRAYALREDSNGNLETLVTGRTGDGEQVVGAITVVDRDIAARTVTYTGYANSTYLADPYRVIEMGDDQAVIQGRFSSRFDGGGDTLRLVDLSQGRHPWDSDTRVGGVQYIYDHHSYLGLDNGDLMQIASIWGTSEADYVLGVSTLERNTPVEGQLTLEGDPFVDHSVRVDASALTDADGIGAFSYQWYHRGTWISGATSAGYLLPDQYRGQEITVQVSFVDGEGTREVVVGTVTTALGDRSFYEIGTPGDDVFHGGGEGDFFAGIEGNDRIFGAGGPDTIFGGDGADTLNGGDGNDRIAGGASAVDLRDVIFAGAGADTVDAGYGNDLVYGGTGDDQLTGGFGADDLHGQAGNDTLSGGALSDLLHGGTGDDFLNGGFGHDRLNGGAGSDRFAHLGIAHHGSDWIQDFDNSDGDVLSFLGGPTTRDDFQVNVAVTEGAGQAHIAEAFVIYRPTAQILFALVDGAAEDHILMGIDTAQGDRIWFDLLAQ